MDFGTITMFVAGLLLVVIVILLLTRRDTDNSPRRPVPFDAAEEIRELLSRGKKIEAIKKYREHTGVGLAEAKDAVERVETLMAGTGHPDPEPGAVLPDRGPSLDDAQLRQIRELLRGRKKIAAIKKYREFTGLGLAEAKDAVERIQTDM